MAVWPDGGRLERLELPSLPDCNRTDYLLRRHALPDGRVGLARHCIAPSPSQDRIDLVAVDPGTGEVEELAPLGSMNPSAVAWHADMRSGFVSHSGGSCATLAPLTRQGPQPFPAPVTLDGHTWRLDAGFFDTTDDCSAQGRADMPALTPDGDALVFLASPDSQGKEGFGRLSVPWTLYRQLLPNGKPKPLTHDLVTPQGLIMKPDGSSLVVAGKRDGEQGLWQISAISGDTTQIADGYLYHPSFSPNGQRLAVLWRPPNDDSLDAELRIINLQQTDQ